MTNNYKELSEQQETDAARQEAEERERKRRERVEQALRRWSVGPKRKERKR